MNAEVTAYIDKLSPEWQKDLCNQLRQAIHADVAEVQERIQYGKPHFLKNGKYLCVLSAAKGWVSFTLFNAAAVEAPDDLFEPSEVADRKTIKFKQGQKVDSDLLAKLIATAAQSS